MAIFEQQYNIKARKTRKKTKKIKKRKKEKNTIFIKNKAIKLRQIHTKDPNLYIAIHNGHANRWIRRKKKIRLNNQPVGVFVTTTKLGISIHNSERFKKRLRKKKALLDAKKRKKPKLTAVQKSKAKKAAKLKKKVRKLKYK